MSDAQSSSGAASGLLDVELVAADQRVWSGQASTVIVRTTNGDLGILPKHESVLAVLVPWPVTIRTPDGDVVASVNGGFVSITEDRVSILAETAELAGDIDVQRTERELAAAREAADQHAEAIATSRLAAATTHTK